MPARHQLALHIFRRDLRLEDNTALNAARTASQSVLPVLFLDPRQCIPHSYFSVPGFQFFLNSLRLLDRALHVHGSRLHVVHGEPEAMLGKLHEALKFDAVFCNRDYTPFARRRDAALAERCGELGVAYSVHADALLHEPEESCKRDGTPYTVFTPYWKRCQELLDRDPQPLAEGVFALREDLGVSLESALAEHLSSEYRSYRLKGGRAEACSLLEAIGSLERYCEERDIPALHATSHLSAHLKFGTASVREVVHSIRRMLGATHDLLRELYWRDFFTHIGFHFPHVFEGAFHRRFDRIEWPGSREHFEAWCEGRTGFPIVDAGMRELRTTGFMHNRVRMVTASFLVKDLHLDWRRGEQHFARNLLDYDPAVNNGNWQWAASTGCDAQPYFRIFNPWLQQKRFDPQAKYILTWVPELKALSPAQIHALGEDGATPPSGYPSPLVDHAESKIVAQELFEAVRSE